MKETQLPEMVFPARLVGRPTELHIFFLKEPDLIDILMFV